MKRGPNGNPVLPTDEAVRRVCKALDAFSRCAVCERLMVLRTESRDGKTRRYPHCAWCEGA